MIRTITGTVSARNSERDIIIETSSGVGYLVAVPNRILILPGTTITLFTHLAVREQALDLYGFMDMADLHLFELLLTLPGIGPKSALLIMDQVSRETLYEAVTLEDAVYLSSHSSVTKKTAEKIVQGLKGKITHTLTSDRIDTVRHPAYQDAFDTLITLGYNPQHIRTFLDAAPQTATTSELVKLALRELH